MGCRARSLECELMRGSLLAGVRRYVRGVGIETSTTSLGLRGVAGRPPSLSRRFLVSILRWDGRGRLDGFGDGNV